MSRPSPGDTEGSLTTTQHAVMVGSLLGDGTLRRQGTRTNALLEVNHAAKQKAYVDWKYAIFRPYVLTPPKPRRGGGKRVAYRFTTRSLPVFTAYWRWFYRDGRKRVPPDLELDPLSLAVWFMDDGARSRSALYLNTQQYPDEDQEVLRWVLQRDFGIDSALNRDKGYRRIRITTEGSKIFVETIRPFLLPSLRYKSSDDPVTTDPKGEAPVPRDRGNTPTLAEPIRGYRRKATARGEVMR